MANKVTYLMMLLVVLMGFSARVAAQPGSPPCGPVIAVPLPVTAIAMWQAPNTTAFGLPLVNPVTKYNVYLDPPGCALSGNEIPTAVVAAPTTSWPVPAGEHALFVTAVNLDGESPPAGPVLFSRSP